MNYPLVMVIIILGFTLSIASCKKSEEVNITVGERSQTETTEEYGLEEEMKKASRVMKRLERAVKQNDWVEIEMWTLEIKEGIGRRCVELYKTEHKWISSKFVILHDKFVTALDALILCSQNHDTTSLDLEFKRLIKSCDDCHEIFQEEVEDG